MPSGETYVGCVAAKAGCEFVELLGVLSECSAAVGFVRTTLMSFVPGVVECWPIKWIRLTAIRLKAKPRRVVEMMHICSRLPRELKQVSRLICNIAV